MSGERVGRASYRAALRWIADNDDTEWLGHPHGVPSVTCCLVADLFGVSEDRVTTDLRAAIAKARRSPEDEAADRAERYMAARGEL